MTNPVKELIEREINEHDLVRYNPRDVPNRRARSVNGDPRRKDSPRLDRIGRGTAGPE